MLSEHNLQAGVFSKMTWTQISLTSSNAIFNETILLKLYCKTALSKHISILGRKNTLTKYLMIFYNIIAKVIPFSGQKSIK